MATIVDVAREAEVSLATVSRVINKSFMVSDEKKERVMAAMEKLNYQPHITAPRKKKSSQLILIISTIQFPELYDGILEKSASLGFNAMINYITDREDGWGNLVEFLSQFNREQIAGIITINNIYCGDEERKLLQQYPLVQIGESIDMTGLSENYVVSLDNRLAAYKATEALIRLDRRRIAFLTMDSSDLNRNENSFMRVRKRGFMDALQDNNLEFFEELHLKTDYTMEGGALAGKKILEMENRPDAILCVNDSIAYGCMSELLDGGIKIPEDIAIFSFDNLETNEYIRPSLSSVDQCFNQMGSASVAMLKEVIDGTVDRGRKLFVDFHLVYRQSAPEVE